MLSQFLLGLMMLATYINSQLVCDPNLGLCKCPASRVNVNGNCQSCLITHCLLCSVYNPKQCDVCETGYVLDALTKSICVKAENTVLSCIENHCSCSPYQIIQKGICLNCAVANCRLCSINNPRECDICSEGYVLDKLTRSSCMPAVLSKQVCTAKSCQCSVYEKYINGTCTPCSVSNCLLCNIEQSAACDVCKIGYTLDLLTKTECVPIDTGNASLLCGASSCGCSPLQVKANGICVTCGVTHCKLCSVNNPLECDVCSEGFVLDQLTKSECLSVSNSTVCTARSCKCTPYQIKRNNTFCMNCMVANCALCSTGSPLECDVCSTGYILDSLTKSACVLPMPSTPVCSSLSCRCSPYQIFKDGSCQDCTVSNCQLCSIDSVEQCDICKQNYIYNEFTKQCNAPSCPSPKVWDGNSCACGSQFDYEDENGQCRVQNQDLSIAVGLGIPLSGIIVALLIAVKMSFKSTLGPESSSQGLVLPPSSEANTIRFANGEMVY